MFKRLKKLARMLQCAIQGHHYVPAYNQKTTFNSLTRRYEQQYTYECECCEERRTIHGKEAHDYFLATHCPTWGERGSDSQGYREQRRPTETAIVRHRRRKNNPNSRARRHQR